MVQTSATRTGELRVTGPKDSFSGQEHLRRAGTRSVSVHRVILLFLCALDSVAGLSTPLHDSRGSIRPFFTVSLFVIYRFIRQVENPETASLLVLLMLATPGGLIYSLTLYSEILFLLVFSAALLSCFYYMRHQIPGSIANVISIVCDWFLYQTQRAVSTYTHHVDILCVLSQIRPTGLSSRSPVCRFVSLGHLTLVDTQSDALPITLCQWANEQHAGSLPLAGCLGENS